MSEQIILDPTEIDSSRTQLDITPWVRAEGIDWGSDDPEYYRAKGERGESVIDYSDPNRLIALPLVIRALGGTTFSQARSNIQAKAAHFKREGGTLKRVLSSGGTVYADIAASGLTLGGDALTALNQVDDGAQLRLECLPDFYEPEVELKSVEEKTAAELVTVISDPGGDMPARVRIEVTDLQAEAQKGLIWAFRSRHYSSASTAKTAYEAEELEVLGSSTKGALSGASNGTAVSNTALPSIFTPVLGIKPNGTAYPTHTGTNRVFARLRSPDGTAVAAQLVWDVGDLVNPTPNPEWRFPGGSAFYIADLGEVRLDKAPVGTHRWQARIDAKGTEGGEDINVDKVWIVNCDEGMGVLSAPPQPTVGTLTAWDNFNTHAAGTITGKVASLGGTWTGAGDAVGFTIDTTNHWIKREEKSDADINTGYYARLGAGTAASIDAQVDIRMLENLVSSAVFRHGLFLRYSSTSSWLFVGYETTTSLGSRSIVVYKRVSGTVSLVGSLTAETVIGTTATWRTIRATVDAAGAVRVFEGAQGATPPLVLSVSDSALASGGSLESGGYGLYDANSFSGEQPRFFDNFFVTVPTATADAVVFASQKAQLTTKGHYRLDSGGTAYGPVSRVIGDIPRLPAGNIEGRSVELFIKNSAGDFETVADFNMPDLSAKVFASRSWLTVPGTI